MSLINSGFWDTPGIGTILSTTENIIWWGLRQQQKVMPAVILSTTTDSG